MGQALQRVDESLMRLDPSSLIDPVLVLLIDESRAFYARRRSGRGPMKDVEATVSELVKNALG